MTQSGDGPDAEPLLATLPVVVGVGISDLEESLMSLMSKGQKPRGPDEEFPSGLVLSEKFHGSMGTLDFADNTVRLL